MSKVSLVKVYNPHKIITIIFLFFALTGCAALLKGEHEILPISYGQLTIFLNGPEKASLDITFNLTKISIMAQDGTWREVMNTPLDINSIDMMGRQILLAERSLPQGRYERLRFEIDKAFIKRKGRLASLALPPEGIELDTNISVYEDQNTSLFLNWNADASITDRYLFSPVFYAKTEVPEVRTLLIYVTNEDSNNVSVINRQLGEVVATIMVGERPKGIALGPSRERIYVANSGSNTISIIDPTTNKVEYNIPIRFGRGPEGIAIGELSPGKELLFVTNYDSNTVSVLDTTTYQEAERIEVGNGPIAVAVDPPIEALSRATFGFEKLNTLRDYRQKYLNAYVANINSNTVSILKINITTGRCEEVRGRKEVIELEVEWNPIAIAMDYPRGKVYVVNHGSNNLSVIDISEVTGLFRMIEENERITGEDKARAVSTITQVGIAGIGIATDPVFDRIYLLRKSPNEVIFIRPPSDAMRSAMTPIIGRVETGELPRSLCLDPEARKIYVVNRGSNNVSVIDKTERKVEQIVPVGERPYGILVFPY